MLGLNVGAKVLYAELAKMPVGRAVVGVAVVGDVVLIAAIISRAVVGLAVGDCVSSGSADGTSDNANVG